MRSLVVEDDSTIAHFIEKGLKEEGFAVDHVANGEDGLHMGLTAQYDVLVVDRMLPGRDGLSVISMLRAGGDRTPALVLSALGEVDDRVDLVFIDDAVDEVIAGRLHTGPLAIAGEWGHNPLPWPRADELPGPACYCGLHGCIETWLSGPGLANDYLQATGDGVESVEIARRARHGETAAQASLARHADRMARALAGVINIVDPDVIVLGGSVGVAYDGGPLRRRWHRAGGPHTTRPTWRDVGRRLPLRGWRHTPL